MVCIQVLAEDSAVAFAGSQGSFELNAMRPIIVNNVLHARVLGDACTKLREFCIEGATLRTDRIEQHVEGSLMLVTALSPVIGYEPAPLRLHVAAVERPRPHRQPARRHLAAGTRVPLTFASSVIRRR